MVEARRRYWHLAGIGGAALSVLGLCLLAAVAADRLQLQADFSPDRRFTLHPRLIEVVGQLPQPMTVTGIWPRRPASPGLQELVESIDGSLRRISELSTRLTYQQLDSELDLPEIEAFIAEHGEAVPGSIYVQTAGKPLFQIRLTRRLPQTLQRELAGALSRLQAESLIPAYVLQGHGELSLDGGRDGLSLLLTRLQHSGFEPVILDRATLSGKAWGRLPTDGIAILAGPVQPLGEEVLALLGTYLASGGRLAIFGDDRLPQDLRTFLQGYGLSLPPDAIVHSLSHSFHGADLSTHRLLLDADFGLLPGPVGDRLSDGRHTLISPRTTRIRYLAGIDETGRQRLLAEGVRVPVAAEDHVAVPLGPVWLAAAGDGQPRAVPEERRGEACILATTLHYAPDEAADGARIALWGSREAIVNQWLAQPIYANDIFAGDLLAALAERQTRLPIPDASLRRYQVDARPATLNWLMILLVAVLPSSCAGIAVGMWLRRR